MLMLMLLIASHMNYHLHTCNVLTKASQRTGALFRECVSRDPSLVGKLHNPHSSNSIEFNSNNWNHTNEHLKSVKIFSIHLTLFTWKDDVFQLQNLAFTSISLNVISSFINSALLALPAALSTNDAA